MKVSVGILMMCVMVVVLAGGCYGGQKKRRKRPVERVQERGLVTTSPVDIRSVVAEAHRCSSRVREPVYSSAVLGYITPWHGRGYTVAKVFANKLNVVSPVWFQLNIQDPHAPVLGGIHEVKSNAAWLSAIRQRRTLQHDQDGDQKNGIDPDVGPLIYPRVNIEGVDVRGFHAWLTSPEGVEAAVDAIRGVVEEYGLDGVVLDTAGLPPMRIGGEAYVSFVASVSAFTGVVVVAHPAHPSLDKPESRQRFDARDLADLAPYVDAVSLMSYDASDPSAPGFNSPLPWIHASLSAMLPPEGDSDRPALARKILLGINFYGAEYVLGGGGGGGGAIVGKEYMTKLKALAESPGDVPSLTWDPQGAEHVLRFQDPSDGSDRAIFYPTLAYIQTRLDLAESMGLAGVAVWELGQGLDYFMDLL